MSGYNFGIMIDEWVQFWDNDRWVGTILGNYSVWYRIGFKERSLEIKRE